jgi:hypothetical protein
LASLLVALIRADTAVQTLWCRKPRHRRKVQRSEREGTAMVLLHEPTALLPFGVGLAEVERE